MHLPCHKDDISMAGPHGFVKIMHLYLRTADIWICWFARFAFVKPSRLHLQTSDINDFSGALLDFSQDNFCIFQVQSYASASAYPIYMFVRVYCFHHCSSIKIHLSNPFSLIPSYRLCSTE